MHPEKVDSASRAELRETVVLLVRSDEQPRSKGRGGVAQKMRQLTRNVRLVFDYLRMSENACACHVK